MYIWISIICAAIVVVFAPCLQGGFLAWDDGKHIFANPYVYSLSWETLKNIFTHTINQTYIPLTTLSFNLEQHLFGLNPWVIHLNNILLHAGVTILVFNLARRITSMPAALISAAIFGLHPIHVESVAWATERKDVLYATFYLLALIHYWDYLIGRNKKAYGWSIFWGLLSILAKPMAVSLPWILLLVDHLAQRRWDKNAFLDKIPFVLTVIPVASITFLKLSPHPTLHFPNTLLIGVWSFAFYLEKFFWPHPLLPLYVPPEPIAFSNNVYTTALTIFMVFCLSLWLFRKSKLWVFACLFYVGSIFFLWRFDFADINIVADRFMYLPCLGFCVAIGHFFHRLIWEKHQPLLKLLAVCTLGAVLLFLSFKTNAQSKIWQKDLKLWEHTLTYEPKNTLARSKRLIAMHQSLSQQSPVHTPPPSFLREPTTAEQFNRRAMDLLQTNQPEAAILDIQEALRLNPRFEEAYINRGGIYQTMNDYAHAILDFDTAIKLKPEDPIGYLNKAITLALMNKPQQAHAFYKKALSLDPKSKHGYYQRGLLYRKQGQCQNAVINFAQAISLGPENKEIYYQRGQCYQTLNAFKEAVSDFEHVLRLDPYDIKSYNELGVINFKEGNLVKALGFFQKALDIDPYYDQPYNNLALIHIRQGKYDQAIDDYTRAIASNPTPYHSLISRGDIYLSRGETKKALKDYSDAVYFAKGNTLALLKRAKVYFDIKEYSLALADIDNILRTDPEEFTAVWAREKIRGVMKLSDRPKVY